MKLRINSSHTLMLAATLVVSSAQAQIYSIGEPTAKEQLYVELINRARANPTAEGIYLNSLNNSSLHPFTATAYSSFGVDLSLMQNEFVTGSAAGQPTLDVSPPLAINSKLTTAARLHSIDQIDNDFQGHTTGGSPSGATLGTRLTAQGYSWSSAGENAFAASYNVIYGHAGFQVDWGGNDGTGMQGPPRGHRQGIHSPSFREIGVGNITSAEYSFPSGNSNAKGPEVVTQDLARSLANTPFITGVAYYDVNGNNFYDVGEGLGGVTVNVSGTTRFAITSKSGGYAVPMTGNGTHTVSFEIPGATSPTTASVTITGNNNVKQDLILTYAPPSISGPAIVAKDDTRSYEIATIPGAISYTYRIGTVTSSPPTEDADQGSTGYTTEITNEYNPIQSNVSVSGNAFRLFDTSVGSGGFADQILTLTRTFTLGAGASVDFQSRFTWQTSGQHAKVQFSEDSGATWQDTNFDQTGPHGTGEESFVSRSADLSANVGKTVMIRFILNYQSGSLYTFDANHGLNPGWYIDNITFNNIEETMGISETTITGTNHFNFTPNEAASYRVSACPNLMSGALPYGEPFDITVNNSDISIWLTNNPAASGGSMADSELDGISNLMEYAFGLNPGVSDTHLLPSATPNSTHLTMVATRPPYDHSDVIYSIQHSTLLTEGSWTTVKTFGPVETLNYSIPTNSVTPQFYRWKITLNP